MFKTNPKSVVGLNIGQRSLKLVQIQKVWGKWTLVKTDVEPINAEEFPDKKHAQAAALRELLKKEGTKGSRIICVVDCPHAHVRRAITPCMPLKELTEAMRLESKNYVSYSLAEAILDVHVSQEFEAKGVKKQNAIVAIVPLDEIRGIVELFLPCEVSTASNQKYTLPKVNISAIIPVAIAHENLVNKLEHKQGEIVAVAQLGEVVTELNIFRDACIEFSRKLPLSGQDITKSLTAALLTESGKLQLSAEEAEEIKRDHGIPEAKEGVMLNDKISNMQALSLMRPTIEKMASEINRSFDFYREEYGSNVHKIILFGGGARLNGLAEFLASELDVEVVIGNSLDHVNVSSHLKVEDILMTQDLDLAIGAVLHKDKGINLLPKKMKEAKKKLVVKTLFGAFVVIVTLLMVLLGVDLFLKLSTSQKQLAIVKNEASSYVPRAHELKEWMSLEEVLRGKPSWREVFKEISNVVPPRMILTALIMKKDVVNLKGIIKKGKKTDEEILSDFMLGLEEGMLANVRLIEIKNKAQETDISEFEIEFKAE